MRDHRRTNQPAFNGLPINADENLPAHGEILECLHALLFSALTQHSRVLVIQFSLHQPQSQWNPDNNDNAPIRRFVHAWKTHLRRLELSPRIVWVREMDAGSRPHWHIATTCNGHHTRSSHGHLVHARGTWDRIVNGFGVPGLVRPVRDHFVCRGDSQSIQDAFYHLSYLAKTRGKDNSPPGVREFGSSVRLA